MTHHKITIRDIAPHGSGLWAFECDCGPGVFWERAATKPETAVRAHMADDDTHEFIEYTGPTLDEAMELLAILFYDMHPVYGSTSRRGRGIGGQAITQQCNVVDPEGWEIQFNERVEQALHQYVETTAGFTGRTALVVHGLRRKAEADAVTVAETDLRLDVISNAAPYPFTKSTLMVTHLPSGIKTQRDLYEHAGAGAQRTQRQARLECIEEIVDRLRERILNDQ